VLRGARHHLAARPHGRDVQPHAEGFLDFRRFGGTLHHRTAFAGATTGQQMLYALDEQVRRHEAAGLVTKYETWEFLGLVRDDGGRCIGLVALDLRSMEPRAFRADAVMLATGGPGCCSAVSTNSIINSGSAAAAGVARGRWYANGEFIQIHPTAIPGDDKLRLMSESARGEGGPRVGAEAGRRHAAAAHDPRVGALVLPRGEVSARTATWCRATWRAARLHHVCVDLRMGIGGRMEVYLDLTHIPRAELDRKLGGILEIYDKFVGEDPHDTPMRIFPPSTTRWADCGSTTNAPPTDSSIWRA
jgi:succinate dehydrogenase / fumarate reductase flavoprotein subunit